MTPAGLGKRERALVGVERTGGAEDVPDDAEKSEAQRDNSPRMPPDRPGELGQPSRADSRRLAMEANVQSPKAEESAQPTRPATDKAGRNSGSDNAGTPNDRTTERESDAPNVRSNENTRPKIDQESIRNEIDPFGPAIDKAVGHKDPARPPAGPADPEQIDNTETFNELPTGEKLAERGEDSGSRADRFLRTVYGNFGDINDRVEQTSSKIGDLFEPPPTGQAETRANSGPFVVDAHHASIDPGSAGTAVLAAGILAAEIFRRVRHGAGERKSG